MRFCFLILFYFFGSIQLIYTQDELKAPVVVIKSTSTDGYEEIGTGILVGQESDNVFILTAAHVLANPQNISVRFWGLYAEVKAQVLQSSSRWDVAIIQCKRPPNIEKLQSFTLAQDMPTFKEEVIVIGHPSGDYWDMNISNTVKALSAYSDNRLFTITPQEIMGGHSGGPVLNEQNRLLGIILKANNKEAVCLSFNTILHIMEDWKVFTNLLVNGPINTENSFIDSLCIAQNFMSTNPQNGYNTAISIYKKIVKDHANELAELVSLGYIDEEAFIDAKESDGSIESTCYKFQKAFTFLNHKCN